MTKKKTKKKKGELGLINLISAGKNATKRLYEMGFYSGAEVKIVKNDLGPLIVSLNGNKIALGRGLAEKIIVYI